MPLVLYHANCFDGFGSAWVARRYFGTNSDYVPWSYGQPGEPNVDQYNHVYVIDFSFPREIYQKWLDEGKKVTVLDHHKSVVADLEGFDPCPNLNFKLTLDMKRSGAMIAWNHFFPDERAPKLIQYIQDRDLWLWKMDKAKEVDAYIRSQPKEFILWDYLADRVENDSHGCANDGYAMLTMQERLIEQIVDQATWSQVGNHTVPVVNSGPVLMSEVGEALVKKFPDAKFSAYYFDRADGKRQWGLRSSGFDVSAVAKRLGGGGHQKAAGFTTTLDKDAIPA